MLVIFDYSGVIADDLYMSWIISSNIIKSSGKKTDTLEEFREKFTIPYWNYFIPKGFPEEIKHTNEIPKRYVKEYMENIDKIQPFPDVVGTVQKIHKNGHSIVILSHTPRKILEEFLGSCGILGYFVHIFGYEDMKKQKPEPDPILEIMHMLGFDSANTIMIGDMKEDIQSAKGAGVIAVAVSKETSYHSREYLSKENPHYIISSLDEIMPILEKIRPLEVVA